MPRLGVLEKLPLHGQLKCGDPAAGGSQSTVPMLTDPVLKGWRSPESYDQLFNVHAKTQLSSPQTAQKAAAPDRESKGPKAPERSETQLVGSRF